jgi:hypothetical protein
MVPTVGNTPAVGTAGAELTPRLLISVEPNGIPVRATPPDLVGNVDVGVVDEAMLLEPEPHIPDAPDVSGIPGLSTLPTSRTFPPRLTAGLLTSTLLTSTLTSPTFACPTLPQ